MTPESLLVQCREPWCKVNVVAHDPTHHVYCDEHRPATPTKKVNPRAIRWEHGDA
jgi:hypothetical protein